MTQRPLVTVTFPARRFFELPNLLGSPHNSALVPQIMEEATARAAANIGRFLRGEAVTGVVRAEDYVEGSSR
jgi:phosphoglycerate dehydrogenase-like enzyme